jgi:hypothetical protein
VLEQEVELPTLLKRPSIHWPDDEPINDHWEDEEDPWEVPGSPVMRRTCTDFYAAVEKSDLDLLDQLLKRRGMGLSKANREAVLTERERLANRVRRAAYEQLAAAMRASDDTKHEKLAKAIEVAKLRELDESDIEEAEAALEALGDLDDDMPAHVKSGRPAFQAIRDDDVKALRKALVRKTKCRAWAKWRNEEHHSLVEFATALGKRRILRHMTDDGGMTADQWKAAFRSVVRDDAVELSSHLKYCSPFVWMERRNAGGKTLLEVAQERGSSGCEMWLMFGSGLVTDLPKMEELTAGESVWVLEESSVQPRPAKVVSAQKRKVVVGFWDAKDDETVEVNVNNCRRMLLG